MKRNYLLLTFFLLSLMSGMAQRMIPELPFDTSVVKGKLSNGLTYYIQHNENPKKRAFFYIAQKVGSVQEEESQRGLAHFLEHMCFNGSEHFPGNGVVSFCQRIGVQFGNHLNAYTACDRTVYNIDNVPTDDVRNLDSCLYILYDWAHALTLDPAEIDKERGVIHEEWRVRNSGINRILERQLPVLMKGSRYADRFPIGLMSVVDNFKPEELRSYYEKWYRPDLQGIVVVGDIDVREMENKIIEIFSKLPAAEENAAPLEYFKVPDNDEPIIVIDKDKEVTKPMYMVMQKYEDLPREYRNSLLGMSYSYISNMIEMMLNYRFSELMDKPDVPCTNISAGCGDFLLSSTMKNLEVAFYPKEKQDKEALKWILREMRRAAQYGFTEAEYTRAKTDFSAQLDQMVENRKTVKSSLLVNECVEHFLENEVKTSFPKEISCYRQIMEKMPIQGINKMVQAIIGKQDTNLVVLGIYPEKEGLEIPAATVVKTALGEIKAEDIKPYEMKTVDTRILEKEPAMGAIKKELPEDKLGYKGIVLSNGVCVKYKKTDFTEGRISLKVVSQGGKARVALKDMPAASMLKEVMQNNGLGKFSGTDLTKALTGKIVGVTPGFSLMTEFLNGYSSKKDFRTLFQLVYLYFTDVNYDTINYNKVIKAKEEDLKNRDARPLNVFQDSLTVNIYGNSPYAQPMTLETLKKVTYDGVLSVYKERFANPADFTFIVTGSLDEDSLKLFARQYLASIPAKGKQEKEYNPGVSYAQGNNTCRFSKKMETPQCFIFNVRQGNCPSSVENNVVASAFGEVLDMYSTETIREKYGYAYSTSASCSAGRLLGKDSYFFQILAPVKPEKCDTTLILIDAGIKEIAQKGVAEDKLKKVKEQMIKSYETNQRKNNYWENLEEIWIMDKKDEYTGEKEAIESLTSEKIQEFANKYVLKQNSLNVIIEPQK